MVESSNDPDRMILGAGRAIGADDPELNLTDDETERLLRHFGDLRNSVEADPNFWIRHVFQVFMSIVIKERTHGNNTSGKSVQKPSTIVEQQMGQVLKACENLDGILATLDPVTRTWLDQHLKAIGVRDEHNARLRLRDLEKRMNWPIDLLINAAHHSKGMTSRGPNNVALKLMIESLARCGESFCGEPPKTDKGRGRRDDPFLLLCQDMARIADTRLQSKGARLGSVQLTGLVSQVLEDRRQRSDETSTEK